MSNNGIVKEQTLWMFLIKMWKSLERKSLAWILFISVVIVVVFHIFFEKAVFDAGTIISFYSTLVGFGIASLSFFSSSSCIDGTGYFPKAIAAVTFNQILCILALLINFLCQGFILDILNQFFLITILLWTFHCSIHVASICLN